MSRISEGSFKNIPNIAQRPAKMAAFFMFGVFVNAVVNVTRFLDQGVDQRTYNLNRRVAQNEHTHAVLKTTLQQLDTRRMGIWDAVPK